MADDRFPYEKSTWAPTEPEKQRRWYDVLERTGPENGVELMPSTNVPSFYTGHALIVETPHDTRGHIAVSWSGLSTSQRKTKERT